MGLKNVVAHIDDILVYGESVEKHDEFFKAVLNALAQEGITINSNK